MFLLASREARLPVDQYETCFSVGQEGSLSSCWPGGQHVLLLDKRIFNPCLFISARKEISLSSCRPNITTCLYGSEDIVMINSIKSQAVSYLRKLKNLSLCMYDTNFKKRGGLFHTSTP